MPLTGRTVDPCIMKGTELGREALGAAWAAQPSRLQCQHQVGRPETGKKRSVPCHFSPPCHSPPHAKLNSSISMAGRRMLSETSLDRLAFVRALLSQRLCARWKYQPAVQASPSMNVPRMSWCRPWLCCICHYWLLQSFFLIFL